MEVVCGFQNPGDLPQRPDGAWMLLSINHGGRESVEFFEIQVSEPALA